MMTAEPVVGKCAMLGLGLILMSCSSSNASPRSDGGTSAQNTGTDASVAQAGEGGRAPDAAASGFDASVECLKSLPAGCCSVALSRDCPVDWGSAVACRSYSPVVFPTACDGYRAARYQSVDAAYIYVYNDGGSLVAALEAHENGVGCDGALAGFAVDASCVAQWVAGASGGGVQCSDVDTGGPLGYCASLGDAGAAADGQ